MTGDEDSAAGQPGVASGEPDGTGDKGPDDAYKGLQRKLSAANERNRELTLSLLTKTEADERIAGIEETIQELVGVLGKGSDFDDGEDGDSSLETLSKSLGTRRVNRDQVAQVRRQVIEQISAAGLSWEDDSLADARKAWDSGNLAHAAELIARTVSTETGGANRENFDDAVQAEVTQELKKRGIVSTGEPGGGSTGIPSGIAELKAKILDPAWYRDNKDEIARLSRAGKLPGFP